MSADIDNMSRSEILEAAQALRQSTEEGIPRVYSAEESAVLEAADSIVRERESVGITGIIESAIAKIRGERVAAEIALSRAREREGRIEALLRQEAGINKQVQAEREAVGKIRGLIATYDHATSPKAEAEAMISRWHFRNDPRFAEHLPHAVANIQNNRLIKEALPLYLAKSNAELERLEGESKAIRKQIEKLK